MPEDEANEQSEGEEGKNGVAGGEVAWAVLPDGFVLEPAARLVLGRGAALQAAGGQPRPRNYTGKIFAISVEPTSGGSAVQ